MRSILYNTDYFLKEVRTTIKLNLLSNIFSFFSTGLIFFILAMVISGWWISNEVVEAIQGEAEVSVYYRETMSQSEILQVVEKIKSMDGIREARIVDEDEAYGRMVEILGKEANVLTFFDENPFSPFIEVKIHLEVMDSVLEGLKGLDGIDHVRDNREVLERLHRMAGVLKSLGYLVVTAVGISTLVIISHIIRQGIYNNRDQINTLRLLGAPEGFIAFPFILVGLLLTLGGGVLASAMASLALKQLYIQMTGPLPFIPLPPFETTVSKLVTLTISLSAALGILGSLFGLSSANSN